jgi:uncharacterized membrane protein (DUF4010 family)
MDAGGPFPFVDPVAQPEAALLRLLVAGLIGGLIGVDPGTAAAAIALAVLSNTVAKTAYAAWLGTRRFARATAAILGAAFVAGGIALLLLHRPA